MRQKKKRQKQEKPNIKKYNNVYLSIDEMPFLNWKLIYKHKDIRYIIVDSNSRNIESLKYDESEMLSAWESCYAEYITDFALNGKLRKVLSLESKIALLVCKMWTENKPALQTKINIYRKELANLQVNQEGGADFDKQIAILEKWLGIRLDESQISVRRFYTYMDMLDQESKKIMFENGKNKKG